MPIARLGAVSLAFETFGAPTDPAIVLIRGLGTQMIEWPATLVDGLVANALKVIIFDNRDAGLSTKLVDASGEPPYRLEDMAQDVIGLLDHLAVRDAHIFGISLGGMIAQHVAMAHHARVRSLISVMSSTANPALPEMDPELRARMLATAESPDAIIQLDADNRALFGSPDYPESEAERLAAAQRAYRRSYAPAGVERQLKAAVADGSRVDRLRRIAVPTLVIHGTDDPLIPPAAGRDTAAQIPNAVLEIVPGMGHNIPAALAPRIVEIVSRFIRGLS